MNRVDPLNDGQAAVLRHISNGYTDPQIAADLHISVSTVASRVQSILRKLGARNRAHAVAIAMRTGQLIPERTPRP